MNILSIKNNETRPKYSSRETIQTALCEEREFSVDKIRS